MKLHDLFDEPIESVKVTDSIWAHKYRTGIININGVKYSGYTLKQAVKNYKAKYITRKSKIKP